MGRRLLLTCALLLGAVPASAIVRYVDADATGANDGTSWANAYTSLANALGFANSGDDLWVAEGTYTPTAGTDRTISFALKDGVRILGGFAGTETLENQRNFVTNITILSGDIGVVGDLSDNSHRVVLSGPGVTASGRVDGFRITLGQANGPAVSNQDRGGGLFIINSSPTIANCVFDQNSAAESGGAIRVQNGSPLITRSRFTGNSALAHGGAIHADAGSVVTVTGCIVRGNFSWFGGAITLTDNSFVLNSMVTGNSFNGVALLGSGNQIINTTSAFHQFGYGIACFGSDSSNTVANTIVWGNGSPSIFLAVTASVNVTYSDIQGGYAGLGNINADPLFRDPIPGDLRLLPGSPAVDSGDNTAVPPSITVDVNGLPRFFDDPAAPNSGIGTPPIVDMGANERVPMNIPVPSPSSLVVCEGQTAGFSITASGQAPLSYRWRRNAMDLADADGISGSATATLAIDPAETGDSGTYDVRVTDGFGQTLLSPGATLTVGAIPMAPEIEEFFAVEVGSTNNVASIRFPSNGTTWNWTVTGGTLTGGQGTSQITFDAGAPGTRMQISAVATSPEGCVSPVGSILVAVDFLDVAPLSPYRPFVAGLVINGATAGCGNGNYCPDQPVTREQMAVYLLVSKEGEGYQPPNCSVPTFGDVPCSSPYARWIYELVARSVTVGCGGGNYCPTSPVTREQMSVFLLVTLEGSAYQPPDCGAPPFADVPCSSPFARWIKELVFRGVTVGCGGGNYCPTSPVTRGQMAVFLVRTFSLP